MKNNYKKYNKYCQKLKILKGGTLSSQNDNLYTKQLDEKSSFDANNIICCVATMGSGSYGKVDKTIDKKTGRTVIMKTIMIDSRDHKNNIAYEDAKFKVFAEIEILKNLNNPYIIKYYGHTNKEETFSNNDNDSDKHKIVTFEIYMEDICGYNLASIVNNIKSMDFELMSLYMAQVLNGLQYLHSLRIIHMDIKSENVLLSNTGIIKLIDFGESERIQENVQTFNLQRRGSTLYIAPELWDINLQYTQFPIEHLGKTDIWSFGVMLIMLFVGTDYVWKIKDETSINEIIYSLIKNLFHKISKILGKNHKSQIIEYDSIYEGEIAEILDDLTQFAPKGDKTSNDILCFLCFIKLCINKDYTLRKTAVELLTEQFIVKPQELRFNDDDFGDLINFYVDFLQ